MLYSASFNIARVTIIRASMPQRSSLIAAKRLHGSIQIYKVQMLWELRTIEKFSVYILKSIDHRFSIACKRQAPRFLFFGILAERLGSIDVKMLFKFSKSGLIGIDWFALDCRSMF